MIILREGYLIDFLSKPESYSMPSLESSVLLHGTHTVCDHTIRQYASFPVHAAIQIRGSKVTGQVEVVVAIWCSALSWLPNPKALDLKRS